MSLSSLNPTEARIASRSGLRLCLALVLSGALSGCSVLAVADAAVTVAATAVSVTATVVETTVDVAAAGVRAVTAEDKDANKAEAGKSDDKPGHESGE
jgi:hypothetical protein